MAPQRPRAASRVTRCWNPRSSRYHPRHATDAETGKRAEPGQREARSALTESPGGEDSEPGSGPRPAAGAPALQRRPGGPHARLTRTTPHTKAPGRRLPAPTTRRAIKGAAGPARPETRLTIAALDFHVNPDLDLAEVGRCHHLIRSSSGQAKQAGRGQGGSGRGRGGPRPRWPRRKQWTSRLKPCRPAGEQEGRRVGEPAGVHTWCPGEVRHFFLF